MMRLGSSAHFQFNSTLKQNQKNKKKYGRLILYGVGKFNLLPILQQHSFRGWLKNLHNTNKWLSIIMDKKMTLQWFQESTPCSYVMLNQLWFKTNIIFYEHF